MTAMWDARFEGLLRRFLPFLGQDEPLAPQLGLRDYGLDSLGMVELLGNLEDEFGVHFLDDALSQSTFATPATLWARLSELIGSAV